MFSLHSLNLSFSSVHTRMGKTEWSYVLAYTVYRKRYDKLGIPDNVRVTAYKNINSLLLLF
jgi:hypothetical protein